ncbi:MAG: glycosyltransferase family 9 protein [Candidatus Omnitrophica bacterium]|nr:glycosyltransferase family 9 protein [Candidatus Omnitrophota bacterium]MDD5553700.1 glycosyltransferase family 9 protein [Candidatus Omnitrophota bacterium]
MQTLYLLKCAGNIIGDAFSYAMRLHQAIGRMRGEDDDLPVKNILLIKFWGIGNLVLLFPVIKRIKEHYSGCKIYLLTLDSNRGLPEGSPYLSGIMYFKFSKNILVIAADFIKHLARIRRSKIDLLLNFEQCNRLSIIFSYLTLAKKRLGFEISKCAYNCLYTKTVKNDPGLHVSLNFMNLVREARVKIEKYGYSPPFVNAAVKERVKEVRLQLGLEGKRIAALHAGSGENFKGKRWDHINFSRLADRLIERHKVSVVFTGTKKECPLIKDAIAKMKHGAVNLCGRLDLQELTEFLGNCYVFISNDTGPLHIAISLGINTAGIYGPMNPAQYGSLNKNSLSFYKPLKCSPCLTDLNGKTSFCARPKCLEGITVDEVLQGISDEFFKN